MLLRKVSPGDRIVLLDSWLLNCDLAEIVKPDINGFAGRYISDRFLVLQLFVWPLFALLTFFGFWDRHAP